MRQIALSLLSICCVAGCSQNGAAGGSSDLHTEVPTGGSILSALRPKFEGRNPSALAAGHPGAPGQAAIGNSASANGSVLNLNGLGRVLPKVSTELIAPPAEEISAGPVVSTANPQPTIANDWATPKVVASSSAPQVASYQNPYSTGGAVPPPPPGALGNMVPPPPAVTLSTAAQMGSYGQSMPQGANPYQNPYLNPYGIPYPTPAADPALASARPAGSPFSTGSHSQNSNNSNNDDDDAPAKSSKKSASFVPINPTGMEARSAYKQRDDLKVLWKGVLSSSSDIKAICRDDRIAQSLNKVDVALPASEATKGSINVSSRLVDGIFRANASLDKRIVPSVKKAETDMVQAYYRYLYSYNKFALAQQTVLARKQEAETADSASESQRAAADLSQAQTEADSTKEDMHSAQSELASLTGASAARTIIGRVSGITPSLESISQSIDTASSDSQNNAGNNPLDVIGNVGHFFHHDKKAPKVAEAKSSDDDSSAKDDSENVVTKKGAKAKAEKADAKVETKSDSKENPKKGKIAKNSKTKSDSKKDGDLSPAPEAVANKSDSDGGESSSPKGGGDISFQLKGVSVTPRKSILTVTIHNSGSNNFSFSPDVISISEGSHKLSEAAVRADFDQTLVQPNGEVKGTITIFGRPWKDGLAVVLPDGSKNIQMRR